MNEKFYNRGLEKAKHQDYAGAIGEFTAAIQQDPGFSQAYIQRGLAYYDSGAILQAVYDYTEAIKLDEYSREAFYFRALARLALKNLPGADLPKVCEHFHIPFQSGDNELLKAMSRGYTQEKYRRIIDTIRGYMPDASISADAIVGFPGETETQFENTLQLVADIGFDLVNTAAYSPRPGTPAALWDHQLSEEVKSDRLQRLNHLVNIKAAERSQRYFGRIEEVLVEAQNTKDTNQVMGRTGGNRLTFFTGDINRLKGQIVKVKITEVRAFSLTGEAVEVRQPVTV